MRYVKIADENFAGGYANVFQKKGELRMKGKRFIAALLAGILMSLSLTAFAYAASPDPECGRAEIAKWITATSAILNFSNSDEWNPHLFDLPADLKQNYVESSIMRLHGWNAFDADDLRERIAALYAGKGHSARFMEDYEFFRNAYDTYGEELFVFIEQEYGFLFEDSARRIIYLGDKWGDRGIMAWDLFRIGTLVSWGYVGGFIEREEAYILMEPAVNLLKYHFSCWFEAVNNYLDGYLYWANLGFPNPAAYFVVYYRLVIFSYISLAHVYIFDNYLFVTEPIINLQRVLPEE